MKCSRFSLQAVPSLCWSNSQHSPETTSAFEGGEGTGKKGGIAEQVGEGKNNRQRVERYLKGHKKV